AIRERSRDARRPVRRERERNKRPGPVWRGQGRSREEPGRYGSRDTYPTGLEVDFRPGRAKRAALHRPDPRALLAYRIAEANRRQRDAAAGLRAPTCL